MIRDLPSRAGSRASSRVDTSRVQTSVPGKRPTRLVVQVAAEDALESAEDVGQAMSDMTRRYQLTMEPLPVSPIGPIQEEDEELDDWHATQIAQERQESLSPESRSLPGTAVHSPNEPTVTSTGDVQEFHWDRDYPGYDDDDAWSDEIPEDHGYWDGSSNGDEVVHMQDVDGEECAITMREFQRQWVVSCSRMQSMLQTRERTLENQCQAQVNVSKRQARKRSRAAKEAESRVVALRQLLKTRARDTTIKSPTKCDASGNKYHPDLHIALTPYLNPLVECEQQTDIVTYEETEAQCEIVNTGKVAVSMIFKTCHYLNQLLLMQGLHSWQANSERECYLKKNIRKLFAREMKRKCEELTSRHVAERAAQAVLLHGQCQTTHMAAMALQQQVEQCEHIGRVMVLRNVCLRQCFDALICRGNRSLLRCWHLSKVIDDNALRAAEEAAAALEVHEAAMRTASEKHSSDVAQLSAEHTSLVAKLSAEHTSHVDLLETQHASAVHSISEKHMAQLEMADLKLQQEIEDYEARNANLGQRLYDSRTRGRQYVYNTLIVCHALEVSEKAHLVRALRALIGCWAVGFQAHKRQLRAKAKYTEAIRSARSDFGQAAAMRAMLRVSTRQHKEDKSRVFQRMHANFCARKRKFLDGFKKMWNVTKSRDSFQCREAVAEMVLNFTDYLKEQAAERERKRAAEERLLSTKQMLRSVDQSVQHHFIFVGLQSQVLRTTIEVWRVRALVSWKESQLVGCREEIQQFKFRRIVLQVSQSGLHDVAGMQSARMLQLAMEKRIMCDKLIDEKEAACAELQAQITILGDNLKAVEGELTLLNDKIAVHISEKKDLKQQLKQKEAEIEGFHLLLKEERAQFKEEKEMLNKEIEALKAQAGSLQTEVNTASALGRQQTMAKTYLLVALSDEKQSQMRGCLAVWYAQQRRDEEYQKADATLKASLEKSGREMMDQLMAANLDLKAMEANMKDAQQQLIVMTRNHADVDIQNTELETKIVDYRNEIRALKQNAEESIRIEVEKSKVLQTKNIAVRMLPDIFVRIERRSLTKLLAGWKFRASAAQSVVKMSFEKMIYYCKLQKTRCVHIWKEQTVVYEGKIKMMIERHAQILCAALIHHVVMSWVRMCVLDWKQQAEVLPKFRYAMATRLVTLGREFVVGSKKAMVTGMRLNFHREEAAQVWKIRFEELEVAKATELAALEAKRQEDILNAAGTVSIAYERVKKLFVELKARMRIKTVVWVDFKLNELRKGRMARGVHNWGQNVHANTVVGIRAGMMKKRWGWLLWKWLLGPRIWCWRRKVVNHTLEEAPISDLVISELRHQMTTRKVVTWMTAKWLSTVPQLELRAALNRLIYHHASAKHAASQSKIAKQGSKITHLEAEVRELEGIKAKCDRLGTALLATETSLERAENQVEDLTKLTASVPAQIQGAMRTTYPVMLKMIHGRVMRQASLRCVVTWSQQVSAAHERRQTQREAAVQKWVNWIAAAKLGVCVRQWRSGLSAFLSRKATIKMLDKDGMAAMWELAEARAAYNERKAAELMEQLLDAEDQATELATMMTQQKKVSGRGNNALKLALQLEQQRRLFITIDQALAGSELSVLVRLVVRWAAACRLAARDAQEVKVEPVLEAVAPVPVGNSDAQLRAELQLKYETAQNRKLLARQKSAYGVLLFAIYTPITKGNLHVLQTGLRHWSIVTRGTKRVKRLEQQAVEDKNQVALAKKAETFAKKQLQLARTRVEKLELNLASQEEMAAGLKTRMYEGIKDSMEMLERESTKAAHAKLSAEQATQAKKRVDQEVSQTKRDCEKAMEVVMIQKYEIEQRTKQLQIAQQELAQAKSLVSEAQQLQNEMQNAATNNHRTMRKLATILEGANAKASPRDLAPVECLRDDTKWLQHLLKVMKQRTEATNHAMAQQVALAEQAGAEPQALLAQPMQVIEDSEVQWAAARDPKQAKPTSEVELLKTQSPSLSPWPKSEPASRIGSPLSEPVSRIGSPLHSVTAVAGAAGALKKVKLGAPRLTRGNKRVETAPLRQNPNKLLPPLTNGKPPNK